MVLSFWWVFFLRWGSLPRTWKGRGKFFLPSKGKGNQSLHFDKVLGGGILGTLPSRRLNICTLAPAAGPTPGWRAGPVCAPSFSR